MEFKVFQIWELKDGKIKNSSPFSKQIRKYVPEKCPCKLCQIYIKNVGFMSSD